MECEVGEQWLVIRGWRTVIRKQELGVRSWELEFREEGLGRRG